jgi:hypothetical protein
MEDSVLSTEHGAGLTLPSLWTEKETEAPVK